MGYCSWVSVSTSFSPGLRKKKKRKYNMFVFRCNCCATICIYNPFQNKMKCCTLFAHWICNSPGRVEWFPCLIADRCGVWRTSLLIAVPEWPLLALWAGGGGRMGWRGGVKHVLDATLECHHSWGSVLNHMDSLQADGDCYDPVGVTWLWQSDLQCH